jgi:phospholipase C
MASFNMQKGDAPITPDNYHQPVLGSTGPDSVPLGFADQVFFSNGNAATPPANTIYDPGPQPNTFNLYTRRAGGHVTHTYAEDSSS